MRTPLTKLRTKKNVTLISCVVDGVQSFKLLGPNGELEPFTLFAASLQDSPHNTRRTYCRHLTDFFDYFYEAAYHLAEEDSSKVAVTKSDLRNIIEGWNDYLTVGASSGRSLVQKVCSTLPSPGNEQNTASCKHAALRGFLALSDRVREESAELMRLGLMGSKAAHEYDVTPLYEELDKVLHIPHYERQARIRDSMMAGVIAGGTRFKKSKILSTEQVSVYDQSRAFPLERVIEFINSLPSYRDKALYSLYAACGCRASEALQLLWDDITINKSDPSKSRVRLVDPVRRKNHPSYLALIPAERDALAWKGREHDEAFMVEPFATHFYEHLAQYMRHEYYDHNRHAFVFQILKEDNRGRPYFLTAASTRQQVFKSTVKKIGLQEGVRGPHSFRHTYGTYLHNYIPVGGGKYGLPMGMVRVLMGHAVIKSTEKYAVHERDMIEAQLAVSNSLLYESGQAVDFIVQKIEALRSQIESYETYKSLSLGE